MSDDNAFTHVRAAADAFVSIRIYVQTTIDSLKLFRGTIGRYSEPFPQKSLVVWQP